MKRKANSKATVQRDAHDFMRFLFYFWRYSALRNVDEINSLEDATLIDHFLCIPDFQCKHNKRQKLVDIPVIRNIWANLDFFTVF
jgi:hypothetical protein